ncbi:thioesterase II family protein [Saccharopolyspora shandongensis]|uniref:thioesterase II family protein n=1 Tax=Saccharopolyspora shandongensis TaxID=418495 RepID=UPI0033D9DA2D
MLEQSESALRCYDPRPEAQVRLFCLPHAGGAASFFRSWSSSLPPDIEVCAIQYPGREDRWNAPARGAMPDLVEDIVASIGDRLDRPFVLFGHSLGAAVAYETAQALRRELGREPGRLLVSAKEPPQHHRAADFHLRADDELCAELARLKPDHADVLAHPEVRSLLLPAVRADYQVNETYRPTREPLLDCPITAFCADADTETTLAEVQGWRQLTRGRCDVVLLRGDHFYLASRQRDAVLATIRRAAAVLLS